MTDSYVTQCPHCGTTFKVTNAHLNAANGSVRCGACLKVFSAKNHLVQGNGSTAMEAQMTQSQPSQSGSFMRQPGNAPHPQQGSGAVAAQTAAAQHAQSSQFEYKEAGPQFEADSDDDAEFLFDDDQPDPVFEESDDDFVFEDDPEADQYEHEDESDDFGLGELSDELVNLDSSSQFQDNPFENELMANEGIVEEEEEDEEAWAKDMLAEMEGGPAVDTDHITQDNLSIELDDEPPSSFQTPKKSKPADPVLPGGGYYDEVETPITPIRDDQPVFPPNEPVHNDDFRPQETAQQSRLVDNIDADPLELDFASVNAPTRPILWLSLSLVAGILLFGQFAWYNKDSLSRQDQYRPWYHTLCQTFGCELPAQVDVAKIKTGNVIVRAHPQVKNGLIVDAILVNRAKYDQPFPELILIFTDINGKRVADKGFAPSQYLSGEFSGAAQMPMNTPIHISLTIRSPGPRATNYRVEFRDATS